MKRPSLAEVTAAVSEYRRVARDFERGECGRSSLMNAYAILRSLNCRAVYSEYECRRRGI